MNRYTVVRVDWSERDEPPTFEVRRNAGGTSDDWDQGQCMGVYDTQAEADTFAQQLRTRTVPACPRCSAGLSCNSFEQYCGYTDCLWNNAENEDLKEQ